MTRLLGPAELRKLAEKVGVRPAKRLGQNFVHDANTVRRIVAAADLTPDDVVLEVGPGLGSLTLALLGAVDRVLAVEVDPLLAGALILPGHAHAKALSAPMTFRLALQAQPPEKRKNAKQKKSGP